MPLAKATEHGQCVHTSGHSAQCFGVKHVCLSRSLLFSFSSQFLILAPASIAPRNTVVTRSALTFATTLCTSHLDGFTYANGHLLDVHQFFGYLQRLGGNVRLIWFRTIRPRIPSGAPARGKSTVGSKGVLPDLASVESAR